MNQILYRDIMSGLKVIWYWHGILYMDHVLILQEMENGDLNN